MRPKRSCPLSLLELAARRRNAQKSTGPRTAAGKFRSSHNSWKHELGHFVLERMIEFRGENLKEYRSMHRDLLCLLLPQDFEGAERVGDLAEALWEKVRALRAPPWEGFREDRLREAEERIEDELALTLEALRPASRKWRYLLELSLGEPFDSLPELRKRIEARLPVVTEAERTTTVGKNASQTRKRCGALI